MRGNKMKTTKEMIKIMQAYEGGERIEFSKYNGEWIEAALPGWDWITYDYRVKPNKSYAPFETAEEFLSAQRNHGETIRCKSDGYLFRSYVNECGDIALVDATGYSLSENIGDVYGRYEFLDRTPCGKEVVS